MPKAPFRSSSRNRTLRAELEVGSVGLCEQLEPRVLLTFNPTADEQYMLELVNRFRANPQAELGLLTSSLASQARSADPDVDAALRFFRTNGIVLQQQWSSLTAAPPLAWNAALTSAAEFHSQAMIAANMQEHQLPGGPDLAQRVTNAGYTQYRALGESIFAFGRSVVHGHAGFLLDWGQGPNGIQDPPGHRNTAISTSFREIGIRILPENNPATAVGPLVMTLDFGNRFNFGHSYLLGVVYTDVNSDVAYSPGEGLGGVQIQVRNTGNDFGPVIATTTTMSAGGYQLQLAPGMYNITFSGAGFGSAVTYRNVVVGAHNVKLDARRGFVPPTPLLELWGGAGQPYQMLLNGDSAPTHGKGTYFGDAELARGFVDRTFFIFNGGNAPLLLQGIRVQITGANASDFVIISAPDPVVAPGTQNTFVIRFDPTDTRLRNASVSIFSTDVQSPVFTFAIRGRGMAQPILQVRGMGKNIPDGFGTPTTANLTNFTGVNIVSGFRDRVFRVFNLGSADLTITAVTIEGEAAGDFQVRMLSASTVEPGRAVNLRIRFDPTAPDFRHASIRIVTNDATRSPWTFAIRGFGVATPAIAILGGQQAADLGAVGPGSPPSMELGTDYGLVRVVNHTRLRTFTVVNDGWAALLLIGSPRVRISGPHASDFKLAQNLPTGSLLPGQRAEFAVRFNPSDNGLRVATVTIASNDPWAPAYSFQVVGFGV
ncbi:MAG: choice-of-anchor D domain-containing protein [Phycisphaeraceae bacterium]|nr:choice-of-anchor D domain-containing protein [Phycisphaeraceae bacterium]